MAVERVGVAYHYTERIDAVIINVKYEFRTLVAYYNGISCCDVTKAPQDCWEQL